MNPVSTGRRLRHYRKLRGWSPHELSKGTGVSLRLIEKIESGAAESVHALILDKLAGALLIDLQDLLEDSDPPELPIPLPKALSEVADMLADMFAMIVPIVLLVGIATAVKICWELLR